MGVVCRSYSFTTSYNLIDLDLRFNHQLYRVLRVTTMAASCSSIQCPSNPIISSPCHCYRCGDVIAACRLEPRPSSCNPSLQKVESTWLLQRAELALGLPSIEGKSENSKRKSEESLERFWDSIDLSEPDRPVWWPFLPKWMKDDIVLCQIAGLYEAPRPKQETYSQWWDRLGREFEEREKLYPKYIPTSPSSFTSYETDNPHEDTLQTPNHPYSSQKVFITLENSGSPSSSLSASPYAADRCFKALLNQLDAPARMQEKIPQELGRHNNLQTSRSPQDDASYSSSPKLDNLDESLVKAGRANSSFTSPNEYFTPRTPSPSPGLTQPNEDSLLSDDHIIKTWRPASSELTRCIQSSDSKSTAIGLPFNSTSSCYSLATSSSPPEVVFPAISLNNNEEERQNHETCLEHANIGKRRRAGSPLLLPIIPSPDENGLTSSVRPMKRARIR